MQRHLLEPEAARLHPLDQLRGKVQPRRRRRHRPFEFRIDGLVARIVDQLALAVQVGRDRDPAEVLEQLSEGHRRRPFETHGVFAAAVLCNPCPQVLRTAFMLEIDLHIALLPFLEVAHDARPLAGSRDGERPLVVGRVVGLEAENLDPRPRRLVHDDPRPDHLRVVEYQQLAGGQHVAHVGEMRLRDLPATVHEQLRRAPLRKREFGDPPVGQVVVESVYVDMSFNHGHKCTFFLNRTDTCARKTALAKRQEPYENTARPLPKLIQTPGLSVLPATRATPRRPHRYAPNVPDTAAGTRRDYSTTISSTNRNPLLPAPGCQAGIAAAFCATTFR